MQTSMCITDSTRKHMGSKALMETAREQRDAGRKEREAIHCEGGEGPLSGEAEKELSGGRGGRMSGCGAPPGRSASPFTEVVESVIFFFMS